jgi:hypothetical protein
MRRASPGLSMPIMRLALGRLDTLGIGYSSSRFFSPSVSCSALYHNSSSC